jgi:membrane associated rhomboid family serine protease
MLAMVVLNFLVLSFIPHVDNSAHVGGLLAGIVLSLLLPLTRQVGTPA